LIYHGRVRARSVLIPLAVALIVGCALRRPIEQRTTLGPTARELWTARMTAQLGREPSFEERRHFDDELEQRIARYLAEHPEDASALNVSAFRFDRQVAVGMSQDQVLILLGLPTARIGDEAGMEKQARKFWPDIRPAARAAWAYPLGWTVYFGEGGRVVDLTRFFVPGAGDGS
jgi:hypothetical protein